jgi:hypothetical protein
MPADAVDVGLAKLHLSDSVQQSIDLKSRAERATESLVEVLGQSAGGVEACWDTVHDSNGRTLLRLRIKDFSGDATAMFAPDEMDSASHLGRRLYSLWGDLLQQRSKLYLAELHETVENLSEE